MLDFINVTSHAGKKSFIISPSFIVKKSKDLMIRGKSFYAIWDEEAGLWSRNEMDVQRLVDKELFKYAEKFEGEPKEIKTLGDFSSNKWNEWIRYSKSLSDNYHELDERIVFSNETIKRTDYITRRLPYPLEECETPAYEQIISTLYSESERKKIEWLIGSIISGDSKSIQKFFVFYGAPGTGKSTIINIIQKLFDGYWKPFDAKSLSTSSNGFAMEMFRENPVVAIQHDGDLSRIEDNTRLNSIISHETMLINEKFKASYENKLKTVLIIGTNKPVKITDAKSGILRRLIDISPTGDTIPEKEYKKLIKQINFELSGIAKHCLDTYKKMGDDYYSKYVPNLMFSITNDFYSYIEDNLYFFLENENRMPLKTAWLRYKEYCEEAKVAYPMSMRQFKGELMNYYDDMLERNSKNPQYVLVGFKKDKFLTYNPSNTDPEVIEDPGWIRFKECPSEFDDIFKNCPAQYANSKDTPSKSWDDTKTILQDIDTKKLHYVRVPENVVVVDFDLDDFDENLREANEWPETYAELSRSGKKIHLHYYFNGDVNTLSRVFKDHIEIKVFTGKSSLRRMLTKCNDLPIATISSGLPLKERGKRMLDVKIFANEDAIRRIIHKNLNKEYHPATKPSMDFIYKILEDAYDSGIKYDVNDLFPEVQKFAMHSTNQSDYCMRLLCKMHWNSDEPSENVENYENSEEDDSDIVFYDIEVFPNLFLIVWKKRGPENKHVVMINPTPEEVSEFVKMKLVGYNCRRYDNHIVYARMLGYSVEQLYKLSQRIIADKDRNAFFGEAYNISYTDVYDFLSAVHKQSLKKWEIDLGIHHQECGLPWDEPVPEELWPKVAEYCCYDVDATEATFEANQEDWLVRKILAEWAGMTVNDTTNQITTRLIVGKDPYPQEQFIYTDLSTIFPGYEYNPYGIDPKRYLDPKQIVKGKSIYRGYDPGEGGFVEAVPGIWYNVPVLDVESMHPSSIIFLKVFGEKYTKNFAAIKDSRVLVKAKKFDEAKEILPEKVHKYLNDSSKAKVFGVAMKTPINSSYGLTSASFPNKLRDPRNVDNIVAKYGALFMIDLMYEVRDKGFTVAHIKTDSIKIPDASPEIIEFVMEFGKKYGFKFTYETKYDRMCLVNDAVYIARVVEEDGKPVEPYWTATGTQFQVPYVFKTLFSKEEIVFKDLCETKSVSSALYLDMNEGLPDVSEQEKRIKKLEDQYKKGTLSDTTFEEECQKLNDEIAEGHNYQFVGKIGLFCPVLPGCGGGILLREQSKGKYAAANGTKRKDGTPFRWMEAEMVKELGLEDKIDRSYYNMLVDDAVEEINKYGDFERFVSDSVIDTSWVEVPEGVSEDGVPFDGGNLVDPSKFINPPVWDGNPDEIPFK